MPQFIVELIKKLLSMTDGYKTFLSGLGFIGYALYLAFAAEPPDVQKAIEFLLTGLGILGLGHKIAKNTAAQNVVDGPVTPASLAKEPFSDGSRIL